MTTIPITNVSEYIKAISDIIANIEENITVVYRGEGKDYKSSACQPNIFRQDILRDNKFFEKNLFDEMTANKITDASSYLEKAIDAQHGGFPSRLLDVTYNCLVALYFATTPYFHYPENKEDAYDGMVYIYFFEKLYCPSGKNINDTYNYIINRSDEYKWITDKTIFQKNHKLIDHIKRNTRIVAQQGALILFQGDEISPISISKYKSITIPATSKPLIRKELKSLFGIHTGFIYPEPSNLVTEISSKSKKIENTTFTLENELNLIIHNLKNELNYSKDILLRQILDRSTNPPIQQITQEVLRLEELIFTYKLGLKELLPLFPDDSYIQQTIDKYNNLLAEFTLNLSCYLNKLNIDFSENELRIDQNPERK